MDFSLSNEQRIFRGSVERVVADFYPFDRRQTIVATPQGFLDKHWRILAELGWMAAPFPERYGGLNGGPIELMLIAEQFGRRLVTLPYLSTVVLGGHALLFAASEAQRAEFLPRIADGSLKAALAFAERQARYDLCDVATTARRESDGYVIEGQKDVVFFGQAADLMIIAARTSGSQRSPAGITLFLVPADANGLTRTAYCTQDGGRATNFRFDGVHVGPRNVLGETDAGLAVLERVVDHAIAFVCAEAVGSMWAIYETTLDYLKTREQFGRTLGSFQALQHRMVDVYIKCELAQSMVYEVTLNLDKDPAIRRRAASAAKYAIGRYSREVGEEGIQLHGGIGMTMDVPVGHHLKRLMMINASFGDPRHHLAAYTEAARPAA